MLDNSVERVEATIMGLTIPASEGAWNCTSLKRVLQHVQSMEGLLEYMCMVAYTSASIVYVQHCG